MQDAEPWPEFGPSIDTLGKFVLILTHHIGGRGIDAVSLQYKE